MRMSDKLGSTNTIDTPESRNGHGGDLAELATNLRSSFDARLPPFKPMQADGLQSRSGVQDQLSEALKKHHRYTPLPVPRSIMRNPQAVAGSRTFTRTYVRDPSAQGESWCPNLRSWILAVQPNQHDDCVQSAWSCGSQASSHYRAAVLCVCWRHWPDPKDLRDVGHQCKPVLSLLPVTSEPQSWANARSACQEPWHIVDR